MLTPKQRLAEQARHLREVAYDHAVRDDGHADTYYAVADHAEENLQILRDEGRVVTVVGALVVLVAIGVAALVVGC